MENPITKLDPDTAPIEAYRIMRPILYGDVLYELGDVVEFNDEAVEAAFLKNNYVK